MTTLSYVTTAAHDLLRLYRHGSIADRRVIIDLLADHAIAPDERGRQVQAMARQLIAAYRATNA